MTRSATTSTTKLTARHHAEILRACRRLELFSAFLSDRESESEFTGDMRMALAEYLDDIWQDLNGIAEQGVEGAK